MMMNVTILFQNDLIMGKNLVSHLSGYESFNGYFRLYCWDKLNGNYIIEFEEEVEYLRIIEDGRKWFFNDDIPKEAIHAKGLFLPFFKISNSQFEKDFHEMNWDITKTDFGYGLYYHYCFYFNNDLVEFMSNIKPKLIKNAYEIDWEDDFTYRITKRHPLKLMEE